MSERETFSECSPPSRDVILPQRRAIVKCDLRPFSVPPVFPFGGTEWGRGVLVVPEGSGGAVKGAKSAVNVRSLRPRLSCDRSRKKRAIGAYNHAWQRSRPRGNSNVAKSTHRTPENNWIKCQSILSVFFAFCGIFFRKKIFYTWRKRKKRTD